MNEQLTSNIAAVIVLHELKSDCLILTQRSASLRYHPGEICFPGGKWQAGDKDLYDTALRELQEELGISSSRIKMIKALVPEITARGQQIYPWFASIAKLEPYQSDPHEVAGVFSLAMEEVVKEENYREILVTRYEKPIKTYRFTASSHFIWGATARIMRQLVISKLN